MDSIQQKIIAAYEELAESYNRLIDHKPHNAHYDRPNTLALLPEVDGKSILDAACGPGKYAEILLAKGATVTGFDISPKMVELAKEQNGEQGNFFVHDLSKPFETLPDESFDIVLCALALQYVHDWTLTMREFHRVLNPQAKPQFFSPRYKTKLGSPNQHFHRKNAHLSKTTDDQAHFLANLRKIT